MVNRTNTSVMVTLEDHFTPDASAGVASPTATSQEVARVQHALGTFSYDERLLGKTRCLGTVKAICNATESECFVNVIYHIE